MDGEWRADEFVASAENKLQSFSLLSTEADKLEEALDAYKRAVRLYQASAKWDKAAQTFGKLADVCTRLNLKQEAAGYHIDAAGVLEQFNKRGAVRSLRAATEILQELGRHHEAANILKHMAQVHEGEGHLNSAIRAYDSAGVQYGLGGSNSKANACKLKAAALCALSNKHAKAVDTFEQVAKESAECALRRWTAKSYFLKAALCSLCISPPGEVEQKLQQYVECDASFASQPEYALLQNLLRACKAKNEDHFTAAVSAHDVQSKLDPWTASVLLQIKDALAHPQ